MNASVTPANAGSKSGKSGRGRKPRKNNNRRRSGQGSSSFGTQSLGQSILPQRQSVIVETQWTGYIPAGSVTVAGNFASIECGSLFMPLDPSTSNTFTKSTGTLPFAGTSTGGASITNNPIGYSYLSGNYNTYKVMDYEVELTVTPQSSGDTIAMAMAPLGNQEQPTVGNWTYYDMSAQRFSRSGRAINGANSRLNTLKYRGPYNRDLGLSRRQWQDFPMTVMGSIPSANNALGYFGIFLSTLDGAATASPCVVDVVLRQRVIVADPVQFGS